MRGKLLTAFALALGVAVLVGCHNDRYKHYYKAKEECVLPPDVGKDPRFDNPPSAEYRAKVKSTDEKATLVGGNKMGGGGGRPGGF